LKYTPVVLDHHVPYKILPNGNFKPPAQNSKLKALQKMILSHFYNVIRLISELSDADMQLLAVGEVSKLVPYIVGSRKAVRQYIKMCLELWSSAEDKVRISVFLAMRKLASSADESIRDLVLKGTYTTLIRVSRSTSVHTMASINLMKNTAAEIYCLDHGSSYQHAFGYVRQLAIHLRNSMKVKTQDAYRQVYNWQYVHSIDFWSIFLAKACDAKAEDEGGEESELKALIYPLVQVTLGAIKLIPTPRYYPFQFQLIHSLLNLTRHTRTFVPVAPFLIPIITSSIGPSQSRKSSTLRPLDFTVHIRAPAQYLKTRVYAENVCDEAVYLMAQWCESMQGSVAFPELMVPVLAVLKKALKKGGGSGSGGGKSAAAVKTLVERVEDGIKWVSSRRDGLDFAPKMRDEVDSWEASVEVEQTPVGKWVKVLKKARERNRKLAEKAREGEGEIIDRE